jgi:DNA-binding transcriptional LysR family regulator
VTSFSAVSNFYGMATPTYTLTQIRHFLDAASSGSFTTAARKNSVSRPAVSKSLGALEKELGYSLFEHKKGAALLTPAGKKLAESLSPALREMEGVLHGKKQRTQTLRLGLPYSIFRAMVQKPLARLLNDQEEARAELSFGNTSGLLARLMENEVDVIIAVDPSRISSLQRLPLWRGDFMLARRRGSHSPTLYTTEDCSEVLRLLERHPSRRRIVMGSWSACLDMALEGSGSAFVPDFMVKGWQKELRSESVGLHYGIDALWKKGRHPAQLWDQLAEKVVL